MDEYDSERCTALHYAAKSNYAAIVEKLLEAGMRIVVVLAITSKSTMIYYCQYMDCTLNCIVFHE